MPSCPPPIVFDYRFPSVPEDSSSSPLRCPYCGPRLARDVRAMLAFGAPGQGEGLMALHFAVEEFDGRVARARAALRRDGLAAILLFAQESHFYLTGFDTSGFVFFQCAVLTADEGPIT